MKAAVYLRISSDPSGQQLGVTRQREDCLKLCADKGWRPVEYLDNDTSATTGKRKHYERMLADIREGSINAVVCWDLDRLHRRPIELEAFMALADEKHVALASVSGDIDLGTAQGRLVARLKGSVAAHETEHKVARQRRAARQKAEQGRPQWTRAFGYLGDTRQPDPAIAPLVQQAYAAIIAGASLGDVCRMWNDAGAFTIHGNRWTQPQVSNYLRKPRNCGLRAHNGEIIGKGNWPGLVDEQTWKAAQHVLNQPGRAPGRKSVRRHLLTGVMACGNKGCDGKLGGQWVMHKTGGKSGAPKAGQVKESHPGTMAHSITYACRECRGCSVRAELVEPHMVATIGKRLARPDAVDLLKAEQHDPALAEQLRQEKANLYTELENLAVERGMGQLTGAQVQTASAVMLARIEAIEAQEHDAERVRVLDGIPLGSDDAIDAVNRLSPDRFRAVLDLLCTVTVMPVGKGGKTFKAERVKVKWR
ncbi:MAG: recombinase family protein [Actinomycetia bacterium]|nr:recombinase family protein [Actinomycetes bacterium]